MKIFSIIIVSVMLISCSSDDDQLNSAKLKSLVNSAIKGDAQANLTLSGLIDKVHFGRNDYNQLSVDSSYMNKNYYYSILLEYPEPTLNLFAIYDQTGRFYLLDKSLNGNITVEWAQKGVRNYCFVQERFLTKDVLTIERLSMYTVRDTTAELVYRELSKMIKDKDTISHSIIKIDDNKIVTRIKNGTNITINNKTDTFYYNIGAGKYLSSRHIFKDFVKQEIKDFRWIPIKPQLVSSIYDDGIVLSGDGYQISLDETWVKNDQYTQSKYLKTNVSGVNFNNVSLGANISILNIPESKNAEDYCNFSFGKLTEGKYKMRSTKFVERNNFVFQISEHSCGSQKFLFIFESTRISYDRNTKLFDDIINSFFIECQ